MYYLCPIKIFCFSCFCRKKRNKNLKMNYRLLLSEMYIDYIERIDSETNKAKIEVYKEIIRDLKLALDIEPNKISVMQEVNKLIG